MNINDVKIGQRVYWNGSEYEASDSGVVTGFRSDHADSAVWIKWEGK